MGLIPAQRSNFGEIPLFKSMQQFKYMFFLRTVLRQNIPPFYIQLHAIVLYEIILTHNY